jgi:hypothetical protein
MLRNQKWTFVSTLGFQPLLPWYEIAKKNKEQRRKRTSNNDTRTCTCYCSQNKIRTGDSFMGKFTHFNLPKDLTLIITARGPRVIFYFFIK